jgi:phage shock protein C
MSTFWVRAGAVILLLMSGLWPTMIAYFIAAMFMKPAPVCAIENEDEREFYDSYIRSPRYTVQSVKRHFDQLERRIQRMEDAVTNRGYEWERRFNES